MLLVTARGMSKKTNAIPETEFGNNYSIGDKIHHIKWYTI